MTRCNNLQVHHTRTYIDMYMNTFSESELASSEEQWMHYLKSIDAYDLLGGNENLFMFWLELQRKEPSLIRLFDLFLVNAITEIHKLAADKELLIESRRLNKLQASKLYDEMNAFISDERERLNKEMTTQLLAKLQKEQREKEIDIQILQREKKVINEEFAYLEQINTDQSEKLQELTESLSDLTRRETELLQNNMRLAEENRSLYERLSRSVGWFIQEAIWLTHFKARVSIWSSINCCARNWWPRQWTRKIDYMVFTVSTHSIFPTHQFDSGTIESLRNKLSLSTSLSFTEVAAPMPAIQTPDRCYKGLVRSIHPTLTSFQIK